MKLSAREASGYFAKPDPDKTGLLIYGEDAMRVALKRRSAYWKQPGQYADPWGAISRKLGDSSPDS